MSDSSWKVFSVGVFFVIALLMALVWAMLIIRSWSGIEIPWTIVFLPLWFPFVFVGSLGLTAALDEILGWFKHRWNL